jgi:protein-S-isoprenylcysteine O-methyltransferase Ste14
MLATLITRVFQLIFAIIVLGLSVRAAKWQEHDSVPATTSFNAFAGALTALVAIIGIAAIWFSAIPSLIMSGLDGVTALLLLAGGIVSLEDLLNMRAYRTNRSIRLTP